MLGGGLTIKITRKLLRTDNKKSGTCVFNRNIGNFLILESKKKTYICPCPRYKDIKWSGGTTPFILNLRGGQIHAKISLSPETEQRDPKNTRLGWPQSHSERSAPAGTRSLDRPTQSLRLNSKINFTDPYYKTPSIFVLPYRRPCL